MAACRPSKRGQIHGLEGTDSTSNSLYVVNLDSLCDGHFSASRAKREALFSEVSPINRYGSTVAKFLTVHRSKKVK